MQYWQIKYEIAILGNNHPSENCNILSDKTTKENSTLVPEDWKEYKNLKIEKSTLVPEDWKEYKNLKITEFIS